MHGAPGDMPSGKANGNYRNGGNTMQIKYVRNLIFIASLLIQEIGDGVKYNKKDGGA
jgi:hypothetical protein